MVTFHEPGPSQLCIPPTLRPLAVTLVAEPVMVLTLLENANSEPTMLMLLIAMLLIGLPPSKEIATYWLLSISFPETVKGALMEPLAPQNMSPPNCWMPW